MNPNTKYVTESTLPHEVLGSATPVLVDFWADGCGGCKGIDVMGRYSQIRS
jgi:thioredoxin 1